MKIEQRPYQTRDLLRIHDALREGYKRVLYVLPTGGGKTIIAAMLAQNAMAESKRILFTVHRRELVEQAVATLKDALPNTPIGEIAAGAQADPAAPVQVASVQTLIRRKIAPPDIVFIDEAHHARAETWERLLKRWPKAQRIGLTATPARLDGKGLGKHFDKMIEGPSIAELVDDGYLAGIKTLSPPPETIIQWRRNRDTVTVADALKSYQHYAAGKRAIFFGWNIRHSQNMRDAFNSAGIRAAHVDGTTPPNIRDRVMRQFRDGELDVVCNFDIVSEGFDAPDCDCVIIGAPTASVVRYLQRAGRVMRPGEGKDAFILDLAGLVYYLGTPDQKREWTLADGVIAVNGNTFPIAPEDVVRDRKPLEMVECELREWGELEQSGLIEGTAIDALLSWPAGTHHRFRRSLRTLGASAFPYPTVRKADGRTNLYSSSALLDWQSANPVADGYVRGDYINITCLARMIGLSSLSLNRLILSGLFQPDIKRSQRGSGPIGHLWSQEQARKCVQEADRIRARLISKKDVMELFGISVPAIQALQKNKTIPQGRSSPLMGDGSQYWDRVEITSLCEKLFPYRLAPDEWFKLNEMKKYVRAQSPNRALPWPDATHEDPVGFHSAKNGTRRRWWHKGDLDLWIKQNVEICTEYVSATEFAVVMGYSSNGFGHYYSAAGRLPPPERRGWGNRTFWTLPTVRAWLTEHMPKRLPALDKLLAERATK